MAVDAASDDEEAAFACPVDDALGAIRIRPLAAAIGNEFDRLHEAEAADFADRRLFVLQLDGRGAKLMAEPGHKISCPPSGQLPKKAPSSASFLVLPCINRSQCCGRRARLGGVPETSMKIQDRLQDPSLFREQVFSSRSHPSTLAARLT
jgi:hypothetical protein